MTHREQEFVALRATIASRGTARMTIAVVVVVAWAALVTLQGLFSDLPLLAAIPLWALVSGYEVVWALHTGVERVGRFIQVFHEDGDGAAWETTAMRTGPGLPGGGVNPLFTWVFAGAALVNLGAAFVAEPTAVETMLLFGLHAGFLIRLAHTRVLAGRQRSSDLAAFESVRNAARPAVRE